MKPTKDHLNNIVYISQDKSVEIRLQFLVNRQLKYTHLGKGWPKHTQCLMFVNGLLQCFETIVKHAKDEDNQAWAFKRVAEKCIKTLYSKETRMKIREILDKDLLEYKKIYE